MPNYVFHRRAGFTFSILFTVYFIILISQKMPVTGWRVFLIPPIVWFYSNLPDIDHHSAKIRKYLYISIFLTVIITSIILLFFDLFALLAFLLFMGIIGLATFKMRHRGVLHTYWFILLASLPLVSIHWFLALLAGISGSSHILFDDVYSWLRLKVRKIFNIRSTININLGRNRNV